MPHHVSGRSERRRNKLQRLELLANPEPDPWRKILPVCCVLLSLSLAGWVLIELMPWIFRLLTLLGAIHIYHAFQRWEK